MPSLNCSLLKAKKTFFFLNKEKVKYGWVLFVAVGFLVHIVFDMYVYSFDPIAYSFINRLINNFDICLFDPC